MDTCCGIIVIGIVVFVIFQILNAKAEADQKRNQEIEDRRRRLDNTKDSFDNAIYDFYTTSYKKGIYMYTEKRSYSEVYSYLSNNIWKMKKLSENDEYSAVIKRCARLAEEFKEYGEKVNALPFTRMMDTSRYGEIQKEYWNSVRTLSKEKVNAIVKGNEQSISGKVCSRIFEIDIETALRCVWFYATEKPYSAENFKKAVDVFEGLTEKPHVDIAIAELYAMKQLGGEESIREKVRAILKDDNNTEKELTLIASALMWINAYQSENMVLHHMLDKGMQMSTKLQERLHSLTNGRGKAPGVFDVSSEKNELYFDVSTLAWKDAEYSGFFENLAFTEKTLAYSLAIRDENKDLMITQGINVPEIGDILGKLITVFLSEYGNSVVVNMKNCIAVSGGGEEKMQGILIESKECEQLGILVHVARIGRRFNIKFYTLFMPNGDTIAQQKQQALSMYNKLSPSVTLWESSIKDTTLMAIQQLLNITPQNPVEKGSSTVNNENPIF